MGLQLFNVSPRIPKEIKFLETIADNIWWCWDKEAIQLFVRIDPTLWRQVSGCAKEFLRKVPQSRLEELAEDSLYVEQLEQVKARFLAETEGVLDFSKRKIAYFSLEFGIHESIRIFSGGLGVLAGDHLKAASDLNLPLVAVGLLYRQGYFRQVLDRTGWQIERYPIAELHDLPIVRGRDKDGNELTISIRLKDRELFAAVWVMKVGNIPLVLLDTELPQNPPDLREVSWRLYGGDKTMRLHQELLLGIGGVRALLALGCDPAVCHMNEGHAGFLSLARISHLVNDCGYEPNLALETVWRSNVFTTHTPVPAGNEVFDINLVRPYLAPYAEETHFDLNRIVDWGIPYHDRGKTGEMSMTVLGLRMAANYSNGVSKLHGEVARNMWKHLWPGRNVMEVPIRHVTNGVHVASWISRRHWNLFDSYLKSDWAMNPDEATLRRGMDRIPDEMLWGTHELCRQSLIRNIRRWAENNFNYLLDGETVSAQATKESLRSDVLTIGFARRFATYKRGTLLLREKERLLALLRNNERPVQFVFAGKAHPADNGGKQLIKDLIQFTQREHIQHRLIFLENYDIGMARSLVHGVDVWLNTPKRPQEASGTSGMKAAINGVINCSILDGWWAEAYNGINGWAIDSSEDYTDDEDRDTYECHQLFNLIEKEIIPCFYERHNGDLPLRWIKMMRESIITGLGQFSSVRMVQDYDRMFYRPAAEAYANLTANDAALAKKLVQEKQLLVDNFVGNKVRIAPPKVQSVEGLHVGDKFDVSVVVSLGGLTPEQVEVDAYLGAVDAHNEIVRSISAPMKLEKSLGNSEYLYQTKIECGMSGRFGITARVKAAGSDWDQSVPGFMKYAD
ncbi:MAG: alpha-glucan family phosphorylase [Victivallaceae bacterium]|nr:alpha-glucan family phosphorylase [Victivallaceae bacterium]